jgi:hypothetical protein
MADAAADPRRVRVERGIYRRMTGVLEVGFKDETGRQRWRTVDGGILAARKVRNDLAARRARGESVAPKPKLRFGERMSRNYRVLSGGFMTIPGWLRTSLVLIVISRSCCRPMRCF